MFFRTLEGSTAVQRADRGKEEENSASEKQIESQDRCGAQANNPRKTYLQQLKFIDKIDHESPLLMMMVSSPQCAEKIGDLSALADLQFNQVRSFTYFFVPPVFWVCSTYGMAG